MSITLDRLRSILVGDYKLAPERLELDTPLQELGIDSLGAVEVLWTVEADFGIKLPVEPVSLHTLGDLAGFVEKLVVKQGVTLLPLPLPLAPGAVSVPGATASVT